MDFGFKFAFGQVLSESGCLIAKALVAGNS